MYTTITYRGIKASASYTATCSECGKTLNRKVVVEHTVNPFNKADDGEIKTPAQVRSAAYAEADKQAAALQGSKQVCRDCEDADNRALLLQLAKAPDDAYPEPTDYWGSPMRVLEERKHVLRSYVKCECGAPCCSGYLRATVFHLTKKGRERAAHLLARMTTGDQDA